MEALGCIVRKSWQTQPQLLSAISHHDARAPRDAQQCGALWLCGARGFVTNIELAQRVRKIEYARNADELAQIGNTMHSKFAE